MKRGFLILFAMLFSLVGSAKVANTSALVGSWVGKLSFGANSLTLVLHIKQADGYVVCSLDSPDQGAKDLGCHKNRLSDNEISVSVINLGASYSAKLQGDELVGTFSQGGLNLPLRMKRGEYKPNRPQTPQPPYPYKSVEVTFVNKADNATLAGTLTYPIGYNGSSRPPVVIMVSGSGAQNRDEEIFGHKPFLILADHLARHGIASLRYDDRAYGASEGGNRVGNRATSLDYKRDAEAGVAYLRSLQKFDTVGVLGHSEGGNIAFMLGGADIVDFVISLAGIGVKGDIALTAQYNLIAKTQGAMREIGVEEFRKIAQSANSDWMNWFIDYDPTNDIKATKCPAFVANGDKDCQVIASLNLSAIKRVLTPNNRSIIKEYPSLNHLFQHCTSGLPSEYSVIEESISPQLLSDISNWINGLKATK